MPSFADPALSSRWPAFSHPGFVRFWIARFGANLATHILSVSVAWWIYDLTRDPLYLGFVGLAQFLPSLPLVLVTGAVSDRFSRRTIMGLCILAEALCTGTLLLFVLHGMETPWPVLILLLVFGTARAFFGPASTSLAPNLVPPKHLPNAIALTSSAGQFATIAGPVIGGLLYGIAAEAALGTALAAFAASALIVAAIPRPQQRILREPVAWRTLAAGFQYIRREKVVLGAISLDLFAVLLGGATALLPVYARDILDLGPWGLGLLRSAPAAGALITALYLASHPIRDHAGLAMFVFVGLFGASTIVFGLSTSPWLSIAMLFVMGASDMVSVFVRSTLIQLWTPDAVRGRVSAVNSVFIGASNELGEFRAGIMAALVGAPAAVIIGGAGTIAVAALWARIFPDLRRARHLDGRS
jgi:MFS family permease